MLGTGEGRDATDEMGKQKKRYSGANKTSKTSPDRALGQHSCKLSLNDAK